MAIKSIGTSAALCIFASTVAFQAPSYGQPQHAVSHKTVTPRPAAKPYAQRYAESISGITCDNLSERAAGVLSDIPLLKQASNLAIVQATEEKGEYESSLDYDTRKVNAIRTLYGSIETIVIVRPLSNVSRYDADLGMLKIDAFSPTYQHGAFAPDYQFGRIQDSADRGSYTGVNAYGAKTTVSKTNYTDIGYGFEKSSFPTIKANLALSKSPDVARAMKTAGYVALVATLERSPLYFHTDHDTPTISDPSDNQTYSTLVRIRPVCGVVGVGNVTTPIM